MLEITKSLAGSFFIFSSTNEDLNRINDQVRLHETDL